MTRGRRPPPRLLGANVLRPKPATQSFQKVLRRWWNWNCIRYVVGYPRFHVIFYFHKLWRKYLIGSLNNESGPVVVASAALVTMLHLGSGGSEQSPITAEKTVW